MARGLWALSPGRRRELLRTLRADLLDLAEDRGLRDADPFEAFLREQPAPRVVAKALQKGELDQAYWRILVALLPMVLAGLWTVVSTPIPANASNAFLIRQVIWYSGFTYLHFALRGIWAHRREPLRLVWGLLLGSAGGFVWFALSLFSWPDFLALKPLHQAFINSAGRYVLAGIFIGITVERVAARKRWWVLAFDTPVYFLLILLHLAAVRPLQPPPVSPLPRPRLVAGGSAAKAPISMRKVALTMPSRPLPERFIPLTIGLQAMLWAGARTSRRLGLLRLFRKGPASGGGLTPA